MGIAENRFYHMAPANKVIAYDGNLGHEKKQGITAITSGESNFSEDLMTSIAHRT